MTAPEGRGPELPVECPVEALGVVGADGFVYRTAVGQVIVLRAAEHDARRIGALFAPRGEYVRQAWPEYNAHGDQVGWSARRAAEALMNAAAARGVVDLDRPRGR